MSNSSVHAPGQFFSMLAIGAGIGWMVGHSASPILDGVITSLLGIGGGIVVGLRGIKQTHQADTPQKALLIDARPAGVLVAAIAMSATGAMAVKAHRLLEPSVIREAVWRAAREDRLTDIQDGNLHSALLFNISQSECNALLSLRNNDSAFVGELKVSSLPGAKQLAEKIHDPETLVVVVEALCEST